jgi:hypothetical protein
MSTFEIRWSGPDNTDPERLNVTAVFGVPMSAEARQSFRDALEGWADRAEVNGFGDWEGYEDPLFSGDAADMRSVAEWWIDASHGDHASAIATMVAWLELFVKQSKVSITHLVIGAWDPEDQIPPLKWGD